MSPIKNIYMYGFLIITFIACVNPSKINTLYNTIEGKEFYYQGRTSKVDSTTMALVSTGASVSFQFEGDYCEVYLKSGISHYNYISFELDNKYLERVKIVKDSLTSYKITIPKSNKTHLLKIIKESEASNGTILFKGVKVNKIVPFMERNVATIEFIGNSITCGALSDFSKTPCDSGEYFDHHNVYDSYGARIARRLNVDFMLSSVSGIGMYRNWNDENIEEPIMPQVYKNLDFSLNNKGKYNFSKKPEIVSICLGTNDMSNGDGIKTRLPFNKEKFTKNYISFVAEIYTYYPNTKLVLLTSPMVSGENRKILLSCLLKVKSSFKNHTIHIFNVDEIIARGCSGHPSTMDHKLIATQLIPYFSKLLNKKI